MTFEDAITASLRALVDGQKPFVRKPIEIESPDADCRYWLVKIGTQRILLSFAELDELANASAVAVESALRSQEGCGDLVKP